MTIEITPAVVAEHLTSTDNDYAENLGGWPSLRADGNVLHIIVTPARGDGPDDVEGDEDTENARHFQAHIFQVPTPPPVAAEMVVVPTETARELAYSDPGDTVDGWTVVANEYIEKQRWESIHWLVIRNEQGQHFADTYRRGLTEYQDTKPYEYEEAATFAPVAPKYKVVTEWATPKAAK